MNQFIQEKNLPIKVGEKFLLKNLVSYKDGEITSIEIASNDKAKIILKAFTTGQELPPHSAPGTVIIFALEGEAVIGYEGNEYIIKEGEQFSFAKNGMHFVKATKKFKMALVILFD